MKITLTKTKQQWIDVLNWLSENGYKATVVSKSGNDIVLESRLVPELKSTMTLTVKGISFTDHQLFLNHFSDHFQYYD